ARDDWIDERWNRKISTNAMGPAVIDWVMQSRRLMYSIGNSGQSLPHGSLSFIEDSKSA
ncbi:unnamed protein product, partial [marine sediment metagenome]